MAPRFGGWAAMSRSSPREVSLRIDVDGEGVVRVVATPDTEFTVTPDELGRILTGIVKAIVGPDDQDERIDVLLN